MDCYCYGLVQVWPWEHLMIAFGQSGVPLGYLGKALGVLLQGVGMASARLGYRFERKCGKMGEGDSYFYLIYMPGCV